MNNVNSGFPSTPSSLANPSHSRLTPESHLQLLHWWTVWIFLSFHLATDNGGILTVNTHIPAYHRCSIYPTAPPSVQRLFQRPMHGAHSQWSNCARTSVPNNFPIMTNNSSRHSQARWPLIFSLWPRQIEGQLPFWWMQEQHQSTTLHI